MPAKIENDRSKTYPAGTLQKLFCLLLYLLNVLTFCTGVLMSPVNPVGAIVILPTALFLYAASLRELEKPDGVLPLLSQIANVALFIIAVISFESGAHVLYVFLMLLSAANIGHISEKYQSHTDCENMFMPLSAVTLFTAFFMALYFISGSIGSFFVLILIAVSGLTFEIGRRGITPTGKRLFYYTTGYLTVSLLSAYAIAAQKFSLFVLCLLVGTLGVSMQLGRGWKMSLEVVIRGSFFASLIFLFCYWQKTASLLTLLWVILWVHKPQNFEPQNSQEQQGWRFGTIVWVFVVGLGLISYLGVVAGRADNARLKKIAVAQLQMAAQQQNGASPTQLRNPVSAGEKAP